MLQAERQPMMAPAAMSSREVSKKTDHFIAATPRMENGNAMCSGRLKGIQRARASRNQSTSAPTPADQMSARPAIFVPSASTTVLGLSLRRASIFAASSGCNPRRVSAAAMPEGNFNPS